MVQAPVSELILCDQGTLNLAHVDCIKTLIFRNESLYSTLSLSVHVEDCSKMQMVPVKVDDGHWAGHTAVTQLAQAVHTPSLA